MEEERNTLLITQNTLYNKKELTLTRCGPIFHVSLRSTSKNITIPHNKTLEEILESDSIINMYLNANEVLKISDHIRKELTDLNKETS